MAETQDGRFSQIEKEFGSEADISKSLFAFKGFGRSTEMQKVASDVGKRYQQAVSTLNQIVSLEKQLKEAMAAGADPEMIGSISEAISQQNGNLTKARQESATKRTQLQQVGNQMASQSRERLSSNLAPRGGITVALPKSKGKGGVKIGRSVQGPAVKTSVKISLPVKTPALVSPQRMKAFSKTLVPKKTSFSIA